jgi:hypothetical protein
MPAGANVRDTALDRFQTDLARFRQDAEQAHRSALTAAQNVIEELRQRAAYWRSEVSRLQLLAYQNPSALPALHRAEANLRVTESNQSQVQYATYKYQTEGHQLLDLTENIHPKAVAFLRTKATRVREYGAIRTPVNPGGAPQGVPFAVGSSDAAVTSPEAMERAEASRHQLQVLRSNLSPEDFQRLIAEPYKDLRLQIEEMPFVGGGFKLGRQAEELATGVSALDIRSHININDAAPISRAEVAGEMAWDFAKGKALGGATKIVGGGLGVESIDRTGGLEKALEVDVEHYGVNPISQGVTNFLTGPPGVPIQPSQLRITSLDGIVNQPPAILQAQPHPIPPTQLSISQGKADTVWLVQGQ